MKWSKHVAILAHAIKTFPIVVAGIEIASGNILGGTIWLVIGVSLEMTYQYLKPYWGMKVKPDKKTKTS